MKHTSAANAAFLLALLTLSACQPADDSGAQSIDQPSVDQSSNTTAGKPSKADDIAAIRKLQDAWNQAVEAGDVDGYIAVLDENIELLPTDAPPIKGTAGYRGMLDGVFSTDTFAIEIVDRGTVDVDGDLGYARYDYIIHRTPITTTETTAQTVSSQRKFLDVMRRQPDGSWRVYKHIWNYNEPGVVP